RPQPHEYIAGHRDPDQCENSSYQQPIFRTSTPNEEILPKPLDRIGKRMRRVRSAEFDRQPRGWSRIEIDPRALSLVPDAAPRMKMGSSQRESILNFRIPFRYRKAYHVASGNSHFTQQQARRSGEIFTMPTLFRKQKLRDRSERIATARSGLAD